MDTDAWSCDAKVGLGHATLTSEALIRRLVVVTIMQLHSIIGYHYHGYQRWPSVPLSQLSLSSHVSSVSVTLSA